MKRQVWGALLWKGGAWPLRIMEELRKRRSFLTCPGERRAVGAPGRGCGVMRAPSVVRQVTGSADVCGGGECLKALMVLAGVMQCLGSPTARAVQAADSGAGSGLTKPWVMPGMVRAVNLYPCLSKSSCV